MTKQNIEIYRKKFSIRGGDYDRAGEVSSSVKSLLKQVINDTFFIRRVTIALFEAEMNVVIHAYEGEVLFELNPSEIYITVTDKGPGIEDIELAMQVGYSTASEEARRRGFGAGMGLENIRQNANVLNIESEPGVGTTVTIRFNLEKL